MTGQCEARVSIDDGSHRCPRAAKHTHEFAGGKLHLCTQHLQVLTRRQRRGGPEALLARWQATA